MAQVENKNERHSNPPLGEGGMVFDSHQHFWIFDPVRDSWITEEMEVIRKDFLPHDFEPVLKQNGLSGSVVVQSDQSEKENEFQLKNANEYDFIKGVVQQLKSSLSNHKHKANEVEEDQMVGKVFWNSY